MKRANYNMQALQRQGTMVSAEKHMHTACCPEGAG